MSDSPAPSEGNTDVSGENTDGFKPVTSQEDLDRIIENRLVRERKKFADYDQLKEQAGKLDRLQAELDEAEAKVSEFKERDRIEQWKHDVAKETGVPVSVFRAPSLVELLRIIGSTPLRSATFPIASESQDARPSCLLS